MSNYKSFIKGGDYSEEDYSEEDYPEGEYEKKYYDYKSKILDEIIDEYGKKYPSYIEFTLKLNRILINDYKLYDEDIDDEIYFKQKLERLIFLYELLEKYVLLKQNGPILRYNNEELNKMYKIIIREYSKKYPIPVRLLQSIEEHQQDIRKKREEELSSMAQTRRMAEILRQSRRTEEPLQPNTKRNRSSNMNDNSDDDMSDDDDMTGGNIYKEKYYKYKLKYLKIKNIK